MSPVKRRKTAIPGQPIAQKDVQATMAALLLGCVRHFEDPGKSDSKTLVLHTDFKSCQAVRETSIAYAESVATMAQTYRQQTIVHPKFQTTADLYEWIHQGFGPFIGIDKDALSNQELGYDYVETFADDEPLVKTRRPQLKFFFEFCQLVQSCDLGCSCDHVATLIDDDDRECQVANQLEYVLTDVGSWLKDNQEPVIQPLPAGLMVAKTTHQQIILVNQQRFLVDKDTLIQLSPVYADMTESDVPLVWRIKGVCSAMSFYKTIACLAQKKIFVKIKVRLSSIGRS